MCDPEVSVGEGAFVSISLGVCVYSESGKFSLSRLLSFADVTRERKVEWELGPGRCCLFVTSVYYHRVLKFRGKPQAFFAITAFFFFTFFPVFKTAVVLVYKDGSKQKKKLVRLRISPHGLKEPPFLSAAQLQRHNHESAPLSVISLL